MPAATTVLTAILSADCNTLTVTYDANPIGVATMTNETSGATIDPENYGSVNNEIWTISSSEISLNGIMSFAIDGVIQTYIIGVCELQCCVAGLLQSSIDCACKCSKCDDDLRKAQKIHLLAESAKYAIEVSGHITDAINKYNSAKSFCDETCGCGC